MKILLNMPFSLSDKERSTLLATWPDLEIVVVNEPDPAKLDGTDVVVLIAEMVPKQLESWTQLRWVQLLSAGSNQLNGHPIWQTPVQVTNASGIHGVPIAQYITVTWLMMIHRMTELLKFKPSHEWPNRSALANSVVRGMTVGIIGYGAIGRESARQLNALGMRVLCLKRDPDDRPHRGYNPYPGSGDPDGTIPEAFFSQDQLGEMLPQCDVVVVTVPSTKHTENMIGETELGMMKKDARMIIISRGGIVNEEALASALRNETIMEAAVDCYVTEPLPSDHYFFDVPNLIMTPHMSGVVDNYWPILFGLIVENLGRFKDEERLFNQVNSKVGY
jgi:phosphoglycerate dehydrogenase-like enzyme